jgi:hypothetical protein
MTCGVSIFWISNGCALGASLCLSLRPASAVPIGFPVDLLMLAKNYKDTHCYKLQKHYLDSNWGDLGAAPMSALYMSFHILMGCQTRAITEDCPYDCLIRLLPNP